VGRLPLIAQHLAALQAKLEWLVSLGSTPPGTAPPSLDFPAFLAQAVQGVVAGATSQAGQGHGRRDGELGEGSRLPPAALASLVEKVAARYQLPPALIHAIIEVESDYNPRCTSPAGAMGLMQLMPETARALGISDPYDPAQNLDGGCRELRSYLDRFGRLDLALAAYNAGPGAVRRYGGIPPYRETQAYVRRVLARFGAGVGGGLRGPELARGRTVGARLEKSAGQPASPAWGSMPIEATQAVRPEASAQSSRPAGLRAAGAQAAALPAGAGAGAPRGRAGTTQVLGSSAPDVHARGASRPGTPRKPAQAARGGAATVTAGAGLATPHAGVVLGATPLPSQAGPPSGHGVAISGGGGRGAALGGAAGDSRTSGRGGSGVGGGAGSAGSTPEPRARRTAAPHSPGATGLTGRSLSRAGGGEARLGKADARGGAAQPGKEAGRLAGMAEGGQTEAVRVVAAGRPQAAKGMASWGADGAPAAALPSPAPGPQPTTFSGQRQEAQAGRAALATNRSGGPLHAAAGSEQAARRDPAIFSQPAIPRQGGEAEQAGLAPGGRAATAAANGVPADEHGARDATAARPAEPGSKAVRAAGVPQLPNMARQRPATMVARLPRAESSALGMKAARGRVAEGQAAAQQHEGAGQAGEGQAHEGRAYGALGAGRATASATEGVGLPVARPVPQARLDQPQLTWAPRPGAGAQDAQVAEKLQGAGSAGSGGQAGSAERQLAAARLSAPAEELRWPDGHASGEALGQPRPLLASLPAASASGQVGQAEEPDPPATAGQVVAAGGVLSDYTRPQLSVRAPGPSEAAGEKGLVGRRDLRAAAAPLDEGGGQARAGQAHESGAHGALAAPQAAPCDTGAAGLAGGRQLPPLATGSRGLAGAPSPQPQPPVQTTHRLVVELEGRGGPVVVSAGAHENTVVAHVTAADWHEAQYLRSQEAALRANLLAQDISLAHFTVAHRGSGQGEAYRGDGAQLGFPGASAGSHGLAAQPPSPSPPRHPGLLHIVV
jgi:hypothetical protein